MDSNYNQDFGVLTRGSGGAGMSSKGGPPPYGGSQAARSHYTTSELGDSEYDNHSQLQ